MTNLKTPSTKLENYSRNHEFLYMLLNRLQVDCEARLDGCGRLWGITVEDHINEMKCIYDYLEPKPQWITKEGIEFYEKEMK